MIQLSIFLAIILILRYQYFNSLNKTIEISKVLPSSYLKNEIISILDRYNLKFDTDNIFITEIDSYNIYIQSDKIFISKSLLDILNINELIAIIFHEIAHYKLYHNIKIFFYTVLFSVIILITSFYSLLIATVLFIISVIIINYIKFMYELQADKFAVNCNLKNPLFKAISKILNYSGSFFLYFRLKQISQTIFQ